MENKRAYLLPFIYTYRTVRLIFLGIVFTLYNIGNGFDYVLSFAFDKTSIIAVALCYLAITCGIGAKIWFTTIFIPQSGLIGVALIWLIELLILTIGTMSVGLYFFVTNIKAYINEMKQNKRIEDMENDKRIAREKALEEKDNSLPFETIPVIEAIPTAIVAPITEFVSEDIALEQKDFSGKLIENEENNAQAETISKEDSISVEETQHVEATFAFANEEKPGFFGKLFNKKEVPATAYEMQNDDVLVVPTPVEEPVMVNLGDETIEVSPSMGMADFLQKQKAELDKVERERIEREKLIMEQETAQQKLLQEDEKNKQMALNVEEKRLANEEKDKLKLQALEQKENERLEKIKVREEMKNQARVAKDEKLRLRNEAKVQARLAKEEAARLKAESAATENASLEEKKKAKDEVIAQKQAQKEERWRIQAELKKQKAAAKKQKEDMLALKKAEERELKNKRANEAKTAYVNENVTIDKKTFGDKVNEGFKNLTKSPDKFKNYFSTKFKNSTFVKNANNRAAMEREALLINFEGADAIKSAKKVLYEYVAKMPNGRVIKGYFDAHSKVEVHSFLLSEGYEVYSIRSSKWIQFLYGRSKVTGAKIKTSDLIFFLTQLSTYVKAGIPLVEALKILTRQFKNKNYKRIFEALIYDLTMGDSLSDAMSKQGEAFPRLLINMIKASEMTGELPESLDNMAEYYTEMDRTRRQMITAMMYPSIVFVISIAVITFIMLFVIPKFVEIYDSMDNAAIPDFTLFVLGVSEFFQKNILWLGIGTVIFIVLFTYLYKNVKVFKTIIQFFIMKLPIFGEVIIYNEVTMFTKTFASLLSHNVFITDSMDILNRLTNNEIYKTMILDTITNLARGEKISTAFANHWAFPIPAYEMIVTGEKTGQLAEMMEKVSQYYQELHRNAVSRIKAFVEPALIIFLTVIVGVIVLAIVIPMFNMYSAIQA